MDNLIELLSSQLEILDKVIAILMNGDNQRAKGDPAGGVLLPFNRTWADN